jgi:hypothetical protein
MRANMPGMRIFCGLANEAFMVRVPVSVLRPRSTCSIWPASGYLLPSLSSRTRFLPHSPAALTLPSGCDIYDIHLAEAELDKDGVDGGDGRQDGRAGGDVTADGRVPDVDAAAERGNDEGVAEVVGGLLDAGLVGFDDGGVLGLGRQLGVEGLMAIASGRIVSG